jgi:hypothetical protein
MAGTIDDYTSGVLDQISADIAKASGCSSSDISLKVASQDKVESFLQLGTTAVVIEASLPNDAASKLTKAITGGAVKSLGGKPVMSAALTLAAPLASSTAAPTLSAVTPANSDTVAPTAANLTGAAPAKGGKSTAAPSAPVKKDEKKTADSTLASDAPPKAVDGHSSAGTANPTMAVVCMASIAASLFM